MPVAPPLDLLQAGRPILCFPVLWFRVRWRSQITIGWWLNWHRSDPVSVHFGRRNWIHSPYCWRNFLCLSLSIPLEASAPTWQCWPVRCSVPLRHWLRERSGGCKLPVAGQRWIVLLLLSPWSMSARLRLPRNRSQELSSPAPAVKQLNSIFSWIVFVFKQVVCIAMVTYLIPSILFGLAGI